MNKLIKLPLFLGIVGCLCGGVLSLTHYFTSDKIAADEEKRANAAFIAHFENLAHRTDVDTLSSELTAAGITAKAYAYDSGNAYIGTIYTCEAVGYAGKSNPIKFTVSFSDGAPHHYEEIGHGESAAGSSFMNWLKGDNGGDRLSDLEAGKATTGSSITYAAVSKAVSACSVDYLSEYQSIPDYQG